jgi:large subunit ribosomal protein L10
MEECVPTPRKVAQVAELTDVVSRAEIAISTSYAGMPMAKQTELRTTLRKAGAEMHVVKNTLLRIAAERAGRPEFAQLTEGPTAMVVGFSDMVGVAKALSEFVRANEAATKIAINNAVVEGRVVDAAYVRDLATVPSREELVARIAGNVIAKVAEFNNLVLATQRKFVGLVEARAKQLEDGAAA